MFKRESEQPVRISFEEKREKRKKRSLRERLSSIPVRRRIEAVVLSVVTVMASLSIDWSSLLARAASDQNIKAGQSFYTVFASSKDKTKLSTATIGVNIPSGTTEVSYTWKIYQNLTDLSNPESGAPVNEGSGTITNGGEGFKNEEVDLSASNVVLLEEETAAVVFTFTKEITCKTFDNLVDGHYVKNNGKWKAFQGRCIQYTPDTNDGNLTVVTPSVESDKTIALTAGQSYTFKDIRLYPAYMRKLALIEESPLIVDEPVYPTFKVADKIGEGGNAIVTVGGDGVTETSVNVKVISFALNNESGKFDYTGSQYTPAELYKATCGQENVNVLTSFETTFDGILLDGTPVTEPKEPGNYTMTIKGRNAYADLSYTMDFTIEKGILTSDMFNGCKATIEKGVVTYVTDGTFSPTRKLEYGNDFDAVAAAPTVGASGVTYVITITGKNNFVNGAEAPTITQPESSGVDIGSVVKRIEFKTRTDTYDGTGQNPLIEFYNSSGAKITDQFHEGTDYTVEYNGIESGTGEQKTLAKITNAGEYKATVYGINTYGGELKTPDNETFTLEPKSLTELTDLTVKLAESNFEYSDSLVINPIVTEVTYTDSGTTKTLTPDTEYRLKNEEYQNTVGPHSVTVVGYGNYKGEARAQYTVFRSLLTTATFELDGVTDGTLKAEKTGDWDYVWTRKEDYTYRGSAIEPKIKAIVNGETFNYDPGTDKTIPRGYNTNVTSENNKAYFIITLPDKYANKKIKVEFAIAKKSLSSGDLILTSSTNPKYDFGNPITLGDGDFEVKVQLEEGKPKTKLTKGVDYEISYDKNTNAGTATITATGIGNYSGTAPADFTIDAISVDPSNVYVEISITNPQTLDPAGTKVNPKDVEINVIDKYGISHYNHFTSADFTLGPQYKNNTSPWVEKELIDGAWHYGDTTKQPTVTLHGTGNLTGEREIGFQISKKTLSGLKWELVGYPSVKGELGEHGNTVYLKDYGYSVDYSSSLQGPIIRIKDSNGNKIDDGIIKYPEEIIEGTNTITVIGKGDYQGDKYYFKYEVTKRNIKDATFTQTETTAGDICPTFELFYEGNKLDPATDYDVVAESPSVAKDGYKVTFTGKEDGYYTGKLEGTFHTGKPFKSENVKVTMYGPNQTGTVNGENRLTYFGNNDPYFILTSKDGQQLSGPTYTEGGYPDNNGTDFEIDFGKSTDRDKRHNVGSTVTVTFKAKGGGSTWYNPKDIDESDVVSFTYTVVPGTAGPDPDYGKLQPGLFMYTKAEGAYPQSGDGMKGFPPGTYHGPATIDGFKFNYTTEKVPPKIIIFYDPSQVQKDRATQIPSGETPPDYPAESNVSYAAPVTADFDDSSLFTVSKKEISANDDDGDFITIYPKDGGWIASPSKIQVNYTFTNALLSDTDIVFNSEDYTYTGEPLDVGYSVKMGNSALPESEYKHVGYYAYPKEGSAHDAIAAALADTTQIESKLKYFGYKIDPKDRGDYVLVIQEADNGHYDGYNIEKFSIAGAGFTAELRPSDEPCVIYGDNDKKAPDGGDLLVIGVDGVTELDYIPTATAATAEDENDGYYIDTVTKCPKPGVEADVTIHGTGNYYGINRNVSYTSVANIDPEPTSTPDFKDTNLSLTNENLDSSKPLELILKNDSGLPFISKDPSKRFDPKTLTLSAGTGSEKVTLDHPRLIKTTVTDLDGSESNLTSVGKKIIKVEAADGAPVTGTREYYVLVLADISGAEISLEGVSGTQIVYTGASITVNPVLTFRKAPLDINYCKQPFTIVGENGATMPEVGEYTIKLEGDPAQYYTGKLEKKFSIVYDLQKVEIYYSKDGGNTLEKLSGKSFHYTGSRIGPEIQDKIVVKVKDTTADYLTWKDDYNIEFENDKDVGTNTAKATITSTSRSKNKQEVYFSIGGNDDFEDNGDIIFLDTEPYYYDGTEIKPAVSVRYWDGTKYRDLIEDEDFSVTYSDNIDATKKAKVTVTGINKRYVGSISETFTINPKPLKAADVFFDDVPFGGRDSSGKLLPATPTITVTSGGKTLTEGTDYTIIYPDKPASESVEKYFTKAAGTIYKIKIKGKGNYTDTTDEITAKQLAGNLGSPNITIDADMTSTYNGKKVTFGKNGPAIKNGNSTLRYNIDYKIDIPEIINAGTYDITITALPGGDYYDVSGSEKKFTYTVDPRSVEDNEGDFKITLYDPKTGNSDPASFTWTGSQITPMVRLEDTGISGHDAKVGHIWTDNSKLSVNPKMDSFTPSYGSNKDAGAEEGIVTLTASGNYTGSITKTFAIGQDISKASLSYDKSTADYDGTPKSPVITVKCNGQTLTEGTDYESPIVYNWADGQTSTPTAVGSYTPVIKGKIDGGYYGELKGTAFKITAKDKTDDIAIKFKGLKGEVDNGDYTCHYNNEQQKPSIIVYDTSSDPWVVIPAENYEVEYGNNKNVGAGYVYVKLIGNYSGEATGYFTIEPYDISKMTVHFTEGESGVIKNVAESRFPYSPLFRLVGTDDDGKEFTISYADSRLKEYLIVPDSSKVKKPGKGTFTVSGKGNLTGTTDAKEYEVYGKLSESNVSVKAPVYTGTKKDPEVTVTFAGEKLAPGTDYSVKIVPYDQTATGGGNVMVTGLGYFSGNVYMTYGEAGDVSELLLRGFNQKYVYSISQKYVYSGRFAGPSESELCATDSEGNVIIPPDKLNCTFKSNVDGAACISAGATVTITSKATLDDGSVVDGPSATYNIVARDINSCDIKVLSTDNYTGRPLTPPIAVSYDRKTYSGTEVTGHDVIALVSGTDYSLSYSNNTNPGTGVITVTGKGNFTGTKKFMFAIKIADMAAVTAKQSAGGAITVSWTARPHVTGYRVLYNTNGSTKVETTGTSITLKDALPTKVGVQTYVKDSTGKVTYGTPKYVAVTN